MSSDEYTALYNPPTQVDIVTTARITGVPASHSVSDIVRGVVI